MLDFLGQILTSVTVSVILVAALGWLTRSWISERLKNAIKHEYDEKLETHKSQLKAQSDVELEKLRADLSIAAAERQFKFTKLHERRAEVIAETYALLQEVHSRLGDYVKVIETAGDVPKDQRRQAVPDAHKQFIAYYLKKKIFLPKVAVEKIDAINMESVRAFNEFFYGVEMVQAAQGDGVNKWFEIFTRVKDDMSGALEELEDDFRTVLGDKS